MDAKVDAYRFLLDCGLTEEVNMGKPWCSQEGNHRDRKGVTACRSGVAVEADQFETAVIEPLGELAIVSVWVR